MCADLRNPNQTKSGQSGSGLRGELCLNEPMARHTSWRVGGPADYYYRPADVDDLACFLAQLDGDEALLWLGLGSNLLVRDGGIRGVVICTSGLLNGLEVLDSTTVRVEAGVACAKVARFCVKHHLHGAEFLVGIPGTMGGALAMNAGAFGGETWPLVKAVETLDRKGQRHLRLADEYQVGYRHVSGPVDEWFIAAHLVLSAIDEGSDPQGLKDLLQMRSDSQPTGQASSGSVFRNPNGDYAGRLIEASGLKGYCVGEACISDKHANFFINRGTATAADIEALILYVQAQVERQQGVRLVPEVHIVGETASGDES